jgi:hypothetical protein
MGGTAISVRSQTRAVPRLNCGRGLVLMERTLMKRSARERSRAAGSST